MLTSPESITHDAFTIFLSSPSASSTIRLCSYMIKDYTGNGEYNIEGSEKVVAMGRMCNGVYYLKSEPPQIQTRSSLAGDSNNNEWLKQLNTPLKDADPEIAKILDFEKASQWQGFELVPSASVTSTSVMDVLGSTMTNKYTEDYPGVVYDDEGITQDYPDLSYDIEVRVTLIETPRSIDKAERFCQFRALSLFGLNPAEWGVNVQSISRSTAMFEVYTALLTPRGKIMHFPSYETASEHFNSRPYKLDRAGYIEYNQLEQQVGMFKPNLIVAGATGYPRSFKYERMRTFCNKTKAFLVADVSDIAGLIVADQISSPFKHADVVIISTQRSLCGPRGALIFYKKGQKFIKNGKERTIEDSINKAVFPGFQGGPHNQTIVALAVALKQANTQEYKTFQERIVKNARKFAETLKDLGYKIVTDGTDNHLVVVNLGNSGIDAQRVLKIMEVACITADRNMSPDGIQMGSLVLTSRGFIEEDFVAVAGFFNEAVKLALKNRSSWHSVDAPISEGFQELIQQLKDKVVKYAEKFPQVGISKMNV
ncbi:serine hydroxymethyltransferase 2, mitochondrial-like isoform X1 [Papaver somniferum]|uniref:serine hydroxymethyltransferase 2, mitochondrial-like isoform X1 n=1 Tax=Papaver somniferum TaxID=3469 RepID=UPI000E6F9C7E|nr:serine hydroxymethyltransferase 2, mitochondrial-like isoform X1 [Papaver somniferum]